MSYILDALKRADAERDRGAVPGLHTSPVGVATQKTGPFLQSNRLAFFWALIFLSAVALLLAGGWLLWRWHYPVAVQPAVSNVSIAPPAAVSSPPEVLAATPGVTFTTPASRPRTPQAALAQRTVRPAAAVELDVRKAANIDKLLAPAKPAMAQAAATTGTPVMAIGQLPPDISQSLPKLAISGSTYSDNSAHRMVILNGQVFHEGDKPAADLTLEQITAKSVILNFKGYRYSMPN